jgi:hypothetical protein
MATLESASTPSRAGGGEGSSAENDVWLELFGTVQTLSETIELASQAFGAEPGDKVGDVAALPSVRGRARLGAH